MVKGLQLQQEIEEQHNHNIVYTNSPNRDAKNCTASAVLIEKQFYQFHGMTNNHAHSSWGRREYAVPKRDPQVVKQGTLKMTW